MNTPARKAALAIGVIVLLIAILGLIPAVRDGIRAIASEDGVAEAALRIGPLAIVGLMALAIVISPIPSGPIAMAAGAIYGATEGALFSSAGAVLGAMIAFNLSRHFGRGAVASLSNPIAIWICRPRSQTKLMVLVFASRLIPFISFDLISYAAGLTNLTQARFAVATSLGVIPMAFAFAAMGTGVAKSGPWSVAAAACLVTLLVPLAMWLIGMNKASSRL